MSWYNRVRSLITSGNRLNLPLLYVSQYPRVFLYFRQFPKLSFNKSRDLSQILCLFITAAIFTESECFWWVLNVGNTVILTGLTYTSSQNVFQDILANSGVKKSIMGRSSVGKIDEYSTIKIEAIPLTSSYYRKRELIRFWEQSLEKCLMYE